MNAIVKRTLSIASVLVISSLVSSAMATTVSRPAKGCTCNGKFIPAKLCPLIHCPDAATSKSIADRRPLDQTANDVVIAGRYRTRGPGAGIGRGISAESQQDVDGGISVGNG